MTQEDRRSLESIIKTNEQMIETATEYIKTLNKELAEQRAKDREMVEWVWSKGVVDEWEMKRYTKDYKSEDTKQTLKYRASEYRFRKTLIDSNKRFRQYLAD